MSAFRKRGGGNEDAGAGAPVSPTPGSGGVPDEAADELRRLQDLTEQTAREVVEQPPLAEPAPPAGAPWPEPEPFVDAMPPSPVLEPTVVAQAGFGDAAASADPTLYAGHAGEAATGYAQQADLGEQAAYAAPAFGPNVERGPAPRDHSRRRVRPAGFDAFTIARYAAPVVFLIAIVAVVIIVTSSGVVGGKKATGQTAPTTVASSSAKSTAKATAKPKYYVVKAGDIFSVVAEKHHLTAAALQAANPNVNPSTIRPGQKLILPAP